MHSIRLGKSELEVSRIGFGGIPIQRISESAAIALIRRAVGLGVDWFDTANGYGVSEGRIGQAIKPFEREALKIFSKAGGQTPRDLATQIDLSLERMQLEYIDLYQFHGVTVESWEQILANGTLDMLIDMRAGGRIRHIGASSHILEAILKVIDHPAIEIIQWPFNFVERDRADEVIEKCRRNDVGFIAMKPFGGGLLSDAQACIRFLMQYDNVAPDPGFETLEQLEQVVALVEEAAPLTDDDQARIKQIKAQIGDQFCRRCGYCQPCPQGVAITTLMLIESLNNRLPRESMLAGWVADGVATLENCDECGECEPKCPYQLPIRERIRAGHDAFKKIQEDSTQ